MVAFHKDTSPFLPISMVLKSELTGIMKFIHEFSSMGLVLMAMRGTWFFIFCPAFPWVRKTPMRAKANESEHQILK
jgi:hypothetical protein